MALNRPVGSAVGKLLMSFELRMEAVIMTSQAAMPRASHFDD
jgi:hypothetical protein